jgi:2-isopropylmalate synthase
MTVQPSSTERDAGTGQPRWNPQQPSPMPFARYSHLVDRLQCELPDRQWPNRRIEQAPLWVPVDLRDGNQALIEPMDPRRKQRLFDLMVHVGFKEIEVGYPAASDSDFSFIRQLIEHDQIPDDVTIVVLTPARAELIGRTMEALQGAPRAILHLYNAVAPLWRSAVFGLDVAGTKQLAVSGARAIAQAAEGLEDRIRYEYSPESFSQTEREVSAEICNAVIDTWEPTPERPVVINLPATVESAGPHVYADQIEWMDRNLARRDAVILSTHPHNDRGEAVAATELALMAGAQRVEGCLFGNGERTGNVCLITLALNLYTQGVDPQLDLSDIDALVGTVEYSNRLPVNQRHPYAGELVYTSFSGTHQDAINKCFKAREKRSAETGVPIGELPWEMPYLPMDPRDVGRSYEAVIRVNSQSGKGGIAYLLASDHGLELPRPLQVEFSAQIQPIADEEGGEIASQTIWEIFESTYIRPEDAHVVLRSSRTTQTSENEHSVEASVLIDGRERTISATGSGPLDAFVAALGTAGYELSIEQYHEHAIGTGSDVNAAAYIQVRHDGEIAWGVGIDRSIITASMHALLAALARAMAAKEA